ncbi:DUF1015 family protein [Streptomyces aidingensis]|uniref:Uncharacterized conserved protein, DUF1015 family n=1 Tax=Streptomyces aidingensis TaxID=910347 RepID=A0A1I1UJ64_9ACTN|nr:DUF1015 domain-containing protein [Streptomyces aidingensis]SFD68000.1 Uncharacterized conserved protein, DUF1015 family [Streptomyces aidingensis]
MRTARRADGLDLAPFRALRYVPERIHELAAVTSPPYDVVVRPEGWSHLHTSHPYNIVRLILPENGNPSAADRHRSAAAALARWTRDGVLAPDPEPALYLYEQRSGSVLQRGLIGALRLTPPEQRVVLPHEEVMPDVVEDRAGLMRETAANLEPLLLSYRGEQDDGAGGGAAAVIDRTAAGPPLFRITTENGFSHRMWAITDPAGLRRIRTDLARYTALIADGHHRWATCLRLAREHGGAPPWDRGLVLLVDTVRHPLRVGAIHRVLPRLAPQDALARLRGAFRVRPLDTHDLGTALRTLHTVRTAPGDNAFLLAGGGRFHLLDRPDPALLARTVPAGRPEAWRRLDSTVLHSTLLGSLWQVPDAPPHVEYLHEAEAAVSRAEARGGSAVLLRPVAEDTVRQLAEQGVPMPQKSTSFGPKPATGLLLRSLTAERAQH